MAGNDASSVSLESTVRVLVSFFLATDENSSARCTAPSEYDLACEHRCISGCRSSRSRKYVCVRRLSMNDSSDNEDSTTNDEDVNFLSRTVRTRTGRPITLSYRALSSY